jgi:hypothetical protein
MKGAVIGIVLCLFTANAWAQKGITLVDNSQARKVEVLYNGKLLTAYCYFDSTEKPILFPVKTVSGVTLTRGYPIAPRTGERTDHPHHAGLWFNYESVNGLDFWNNSSAIPSERKHLYGSIKHQKVISSGSRGNQATLKTLSHWVDQKGNVLLEEVTTFSFKVAGKDFIIDRASTLQAVADEVVFKDVKDGTLGVRVARSLEMPSNQKDKFVDSQGNETTVPALNSDGVSGMYINREGVKGDEVWSTKSPWAQLYGVTENKRVSLTIIDHPSNPGYPTYWHARGYGLFAANPLGRKIFSEGKEEMNLTLKKGQTSSFVYRVVVHEGDALNNQEVDKIMADFHSGKKAY